MSNIQLTDTGGDFLKAQRQHLTGEAKWKDIEDLIGRWAKRNPRGAWELEQELKATRAGLYDKKKGQWKRSFSGEGLKVNPDMKFGLMINGELLAYIEFFYPDIMSTKESMHEFMRRLPKFRIPEVVK